MPTKCQLFAKSAYVKRNIRYRSLFTTLQFCIPHLVHVRNCAELLGVGLDQGVEPVRVAGHAVLEEAGTLQELGQGAGPRASTFTYSYSYRYIRPELVGTVGTWSVGRQLNRYYVVGI